MPDTFPQKVAFGLYGFIWRLMGPCLALNPRLAEGFDERTVQTELPSARIWIQAASVGESYLALSLFNSFEKPALSPVLLTSSTSQGVGILKRGIKSGTNSHGVQGAVSFFPFDSPDVMERVVERISPDVMVLIESEIWPGLLSALKRYGSYVLIINGRMTEKSAVRYRLWPALWQSIAPNKILATTSEDVARFKSLFGTSEVALMPNMKFDRLSVRSNSGAEDWLARFVPSGWTFLVLGSVRREEEQWVEKIIRYIQRRRPDTIIGLFPKHEHRVAYWKRRLTSCNIKWSLRSERHACVPTGMIVIWDVFGELEAAYKRSQAAFVGGSLAPLGGHNFLEPLMCGVKPVIGPYWNDFKWAGSEIVARGLVRVASGWEEVAHTLVGDIGKTQAREKVKKEAREYVKYRRGGTVQACREIEAAVIARSSGSSTSDRGLVGSTSHKETEQRVYD